MPNGDEFARITHVLENLKQGQPIGRESFGLIRPVAPQAMQKFSQRVAADTRSGPQGKTSSTWLNARYGGGKTQALQLLKGMLSDANYGQFKVFAPSIDLNFENSRSARGLQLALFENASSLAPKPPTVETSEV